MSLWQARPGNCFRPCRSSKVVVNAPLLQKLGPFLKEAKERRERKLPQQFEQQ